MTERVTDAKLHVLAGYSYLADGTKLSVRDQAGNGYTYLGSLIYQSNRGQLTLEGTQFDGGGGYMGGSAANNNWNPFQWNWGSGKTWGGFFGGAIQGGIGGAAFAYGLSSMTGQTLFTHKPLTTLAYIPRGTSLLFSTAKFLTTGVSMINNFENAMDIIRGNYLYQGDNFLEKIWGGVSRSLWERPQQFGGNILAHARNGFSRVDVSYFEGAIVIDRTSSQKHSGLTAGNIINGWNIYSDNSSMLYHEYGHVIQSRYFGPSYLLAVGIPSVKAAGKDRGYWTEKMANTLSYDYFGHDVWSQTAGSRYDNENNPYYPIY